jgi:hypothetical protein
MSDIGMRDHRRSDKRRSISTEGNEENEVEDCLLFTIKIFVHFVTFCSLLAIISEIRYRNERSQAQRREGDQFQQKKTKSRSGW